MATTTVASLLRLDHAELCNECHDLLQAGTPVAHAGAGSVTCLACCDGLAPSHRVVRTDAWSVLDDPELRRRLRQRAAPAGGHLARSA